MAALNRFRLVPAIVAGADADPDDPDPAVVRVRVAVAARDGAPRPSTARPSTTRRRERTPGGEPTESELQAWRWIELRRLVTYEALALVVVLGFTAVLVNTTPGRTAMARRSPRWSTSPRTPRAAP